MDDWEAQTQAAVDAANEHLHGRRADNVVTQVSIDGVTWMEVAPGAEPMPYPYIRTVVRRP